VYPAELIASGRSIPFDAQFALTNEREFALEGPKGFLRGFTSGVILDDDRSAVLHLARSKFRRYNIHLQNDLYCVPRIPGRLQTIGNILKRGRGK